MADHFDSLETRDPAERETRFFARFAEFLQAALAAAPGLKRHLGSVDPTAITSRETLATLPVLRKQRLKALQAEDPPFGGFVPAAALVGTRMFMSPGPIWEPQPPGIDPWAVSRALHAAGFRRGDRVVNCFSHHVTPGGFMLDEGLRALGCNVFPSGPGESERQAETIAALKATGYVGTPDFLKVILEKAEETGRDVSSLRRALVSGGALFPKLRQFYAGRGISVMQAYANADVGVIAYEAMHEGAVCPGLVASEDMLVEIVRPGTGEILPEGEVGEVVVTTLNPAYPLVRFGTGDLSAVLSGPSPCGRTNTRLRGWLGRADQRTKVKGMFVDPAQIAAVLKRHPEIGRARLVVERAGEQDRMTLRAEPKTDQALDPAAIAATLQAETRLRGEVEAVPPGTLPNDGKVIEDLRKYD
ncbi:phenylacetate--CoA ligase family protein [Faunimonas sp. B44]|uniref:phenylacetate--CoA ligase family protein n=1 Tax=Faunimonas sp. B44 TaxID=3461493 RepID=UPI004043AEFF